MKQTIEIEVPEGKKAVWKEGKIVFEDVTLPNTWEEFCSIERREKLFYYISEVDSNVFCVTRTSLHSEKDRNLLSSKYAARQHLALMQLHLLRDYYRQGWVPNFEDNKHKYKIVCDTAKYGLMVLMDKSSLTPSFLSFQSEEIAEKFLNNFKDLIIQAGDLLL